MKGSLASSAVIQAVVDAQRRKAARKAARRRRPAPRPEAAAPAAGEAGAVRAKIAVREEDLNLVVAIRSRARNAGLKVRKRDILRAGLFMLAALGDEELGDALSDAL